MENKYRKIYEHPDFYPIQDAIDRAFDQLLDELQTHAIKTACDYRADELINHITKYVLDSNPDILVDMIADMATE